MAAAKRGEPKSGPAGDAADLIAQAHRRLGGETIMVLEERGGRLEAVERDLRIQDVIAARERGGRLIAVTSDGRKRDLGVIG